MKKMLLLILLLFIFYDNAYASTSTAASYVLMDMDSNRVIKEKNKDIPRLIASITKIMTCILAIENSNLDDVVTVDETILDSYGSGSLFQVKSYLR